MRPIAQANNISSVDIAESLIRWGAIVAGVFAALIVGLLFNLSGAAIGLSIFFPKAEVLGPLGVGTMIWLMLSGIASMYVGGWVAAYFSNAQSTLQAMLHGAMVSGVSTLLSLILMVTAVGAIFSSSFSLLGNVVSVSASAVNESASFLDKGLKEVSRLSPELSYKVKSSLPDLKPIVDKIMQNGSELISKKSPEFKTDISPQKLKSETEKLIQAYLNSDNLTAESARRELVKHLVEVTGRTPEEIQETVDQWHKMYVEAKEKAVHMMQEASTKVAKALRQLALINFFLLLSSVIAAMCGATSGRNYQYQGTQYVENS